MARGQASKEKIAEQILATFKGSFRYEKELRIPVYEDGELIQIKVTLTAAKTNVENGEDNFVPGDVNTEKSGAEVASQPASAANIEPTAEEKQMVSDLLARLGL